MNRAWIPAGALAGVSVAGLIALGPLTDSLTPPVTFSSVVTVAAPQSTFKPVRVSVNAGQKGNITHATVTRGGHSVVDANAAAGEVAYAKKPASQPRATPTTSAAPPPAPSPPPAKTPKKTVKRQSSIGGSSGPNDSGGLVSGASDGSPGRGEQSNTPGTDTPAP